jgi:hypothetical protein
MSQSLVTSGDATTGHLLVMKGSFFNETLESLSGEWTEHVWTLFWVKQGIRIFGNFGGEPPINKAHQIMTYLTLLLFPTIMSWLLTKLANVSHDLMRQWEWNHFWLAVHHHPRKHCKKKKKARWPSNLLANTKDKGKGFVHQLTFYLWPSLPSELVFKPRTLYAASRQLSPSNDCPSLFLCCSHLIALTSPKDAFRHQLLCHRHQHFCLNHTRESPWPIWGPQDA